MQNPYIIYEDKVIEGYDIELEIQVPNDETLRNLIEEIRANFSDIDYELLHYYKEYRLRFLPLHKVHPSKT